MSEVRKLRRDRHGPRTQLDVKSRTIFGWCMYDWANSAYMTTVAAAFLPIYFQEVVSPGGPTSLTMWAWTYSASSLIAFLIAPVLGAIADYSACKKKFLLTFAGTGSMCTLLLALSGPGDVYWTLSLFLVTQVCFVSANVFYDAFLPGIAEGTTAQDKLSAKGYAYGYIGGGLQFAISLAIYTLRAPLGLTQVSAAQAAILMAGIWWAGFTLITARYLTERGTNTKSLTLGGYVSVGLSRTWSILRHVRRYRFLALFLVAFMLYNDGIQTVIQMSAPYGKDLGISTDMLMITLLVTQILGAVGSFAFERIAHRIGTKPTIMISLVLLTGVVVFAYFIQTAREFLMLGTVVGFAYGGSQALSRSYYSSMIPAEASAEFFGFYTVFSKFSSIWGTFFFGAATLAQGSARPAILGTAGFFIVGLTLLAFVNERKAQSVTQRTFS